MGRLEYLEKVLVSSKYTKEIESIEKEIDGLKSMLTDKLENMTSEKQIEIMKKLFSKKRGIMNRLAATDNSPTSGFNRIAKIINDHPDNPLNIRKNNIIEKANYLREKFREGDYHKNLTQNSKLRYYKLSELKEDFEKLNSSFAQKNKFLINNVKTFNSKWLGRGIIICWSEDKHDDNDLYVKCMDPHPDNKYYDSAWKRNYRKKYVKGGKDYMDKWEDIERQRDEILKEYENQMSRYTKEEIKNILRATSDYTDFIKCVKNEFTNYYKKQSKLSTKTLGGKQKQRFAQICMNLKYNPPTEQEIRSQISELNTKASEREDKMVRENLNDF